ncbi:serine protease inhibitor Cvsi-2-like [Mercenaria mercenaria]|uniref:serine protease inhibitor Cvsi-2-like n=1 Tax=Mercenaria mercenaria TaxID=6596 RepID=UPI00234F6008|nr:serine protease inhibitor Cvsi-2-like [Mercenaria mercenaria]
MRQAVIFSILVAIAVCIFHAFVNAESCTLASDCKSTACNTGYHVVCEHKETGVVQDAGLCTCAVDNLNCTSKDDCLALNLPSYTCISDDHKHCYDNKCICTWW